MTAPPRKSDLPPPALPRTANGQADWVRVPPELRFRKPVTRQARAFVAGPARVDPSDEAHGIDPSTFSPEEYGKYAAVSDIWYGAIRLIADNLSKLPLRAYDGDPDGDFDDLSLSHPLTQLIRNPNPRWGTRRMVQHWVWDRFNWGVIFNALERGRSGRMPPRELWRMRPDRVRVHPSATDYIAGFTYEVNGHEIQFAPGEMLWMPNPNPIDEYSGLAPLAPARLGLDTAHAAMRSNHAIHANGTRISAIVSPSDQDAVLTGDDMDFIEKFLADLYRGVENAHKMGIFPKGVNITPLTILPKDAEYIGQLRWIVGVANRATGVPVEMLGDHERATFSNIDAALISLYQDAILPVAEFLADEFTRQVAQLFGPNLFVRFDFSDVGVLQQDMTEVTQQASVWIDRGVPLNKVLAEMAPSMLPDTGEGWEWGDVPIWEAKAATQAQFAPDPMDEAPAVSGQVPGQADVVGADDPERDLLGMIRELQTERRAIEFGSPEHTAKWRRFTRQLERRERSFVRELRELFRRQQESVIARLRDPGRSDGDVTRAIEASVEEPFDREEWGRKFVAAMLPQFEDIVSDAAFETLDDLGVVDAVFDLENPLTADWLRKASQRFAERVNETTWDALRDSLADGLKAGEDIDALTERVRGVMKDARESRARQEARLMTTAASNAGALHAARQAGVVGKVWVAAQDERGSHRDAHGQEVGLDDPFIVGDGSGLAPGQIVGDDGDGCRCTLVFVLAGGRMIVPVLSDTRRMMRKG